MPRHLSLITALMLFSGLLSGCGAIGTAPQTTLGKAPPDAAPGTCWATQTQPAVIETRTQQKIVRPAETTPDGTVVSPAQYETETTQVIAQDRKETWFETPCAGTLTPEFIASVQRALKVRGAYRGPVNGVLDRRTGRAIRAWQKQRGIDSPVLALSTARALGLIAVARS